MIKPHLFLLLSLFLVCCASPELSEQPPEQSRFNRATDLLLLHYDCKTDVDDLHSIAAFATLINDSNYADLSYHAVAGTYGIQEGLYVPPNELFELAFGEKWSDAHANRDSAVAQVRQLAQSTLSKGGNIWIADAGQSDFSASLVQNLQSQLPSLNAKGKIHIVQHANWNEEVTTPELLVFVKEQADYHKISDGNAVGNGTPGFRSPEFTTWKQSLNDPHLQSIWLLADSLSTLYNGQEGRYLNEAIHAGGVDFSDFAEICWILGLEDMEDSEAFFENFVK